MPLIERSTGVGYEELAFNVHFFFCLHLLSTERCMKTSKGQALQYDDQNIWGRKFDLKECKMVDSQEKPTDRIRKVYVLRNDQS